MPPQHKEKLSATAPPLAAVATLGIGGIGSGEAGAIALGQVRISDTPDGTPHKRTGTAIAPERVLTAAHCVEGPSINVGRQQNK
ncbi:hypothetical protein [Corynebacterium phoceense]